LVATQQIGTAGAVDFGNYSTIYWPNFTNGGSDVPDRQVLEITTLTLNYFPGESAGVLGRADIAGRDAAQTAVWRLEIVYVEPKKTVHLVFQRRYGLKQAVTWRSDL
jgi:hypothetical protein